MGLTLDTWSHHNHLSAVLGTAKAVPDCTFILNHIGGPLRSRGGWEDVRAQVDAEWREHITALSKLPNIVVKVGGAGMPSMGIPSVEDSWPRAEAPPSSQEMADAVYPFYEHVIREFGADRCEHCSVARYAVASGDCLALRGVCCRHVREQLPGGQGELQLQSPLERLQANRRAARPDRGGEGPNLCGHGRARLQAVAGLEAVRPMFWQQYTQTNPPENAHHTNCATQYR